MNKSELKRLLAKSKQVGARALEIIKKGELTDWVLSPGEDDTYQAQVRIFVLAQREDGIDVDAATGEACSEPITRELGVPAKIQGSQYRALWRKADHGILDARKRVAVRLTVERAVAILVELERELSSRVGKPVRLKIVVRPDRLETGAAAPAPGGRAGGEPAAPAVP